MFPFKSFHLFSTLKFDYDKSKQREHKINIKVLNASGKSNKLLTQAKKQIANSSQALPRFVNGILKTDYYGTNEPHSPRTCAN